MDPLRRCTVTLALLAMLALVSACASRPYLHWQGGDVFGVFEADGRSPSRIDCPGTMTERFACFAARARERVRGTSGALAVVTSDGAFLQTTTTEPGQAVPTTSETLFPLMSVTKMFTAATAVSLAQEGILDLHRPIASYLPELLRFDRRENSSFRGQVSAHYAHIAFRAQVHYPWYPAKGVEVTVHYREKRGGQQALVRSFPDAIAAVVIPAGMFDRAMFDPFELGIEFF
jgi:CubicO group peptidase (beta-lactamase class C family)